ncbi:sulfurtransferase [Lacinutrix salivirga]
MKDFNAIVSAKWLYNNLGNEQLIILDASMPKVTETASVKTNVQIPKAQFFDIKHTFSDTNARFPNTIPSAEQFTLEAQQLGINSNSYIIIYDDKGMYSSPRAYWLLKTFGHTQVSVLNGGLPEWIAQGFITETKTISTKPKIKKGNFKAKLNNNKITYFEALETHSQHKDYVIIDARSKARFNSEVPEPRVGLRNGTIPNSKNLPFESVLNNGKLKSKAELQDIFSKFATTGKQLIFTCGSGITASILDLAATLADYKNTAVYDGSWTEYGSLTTQTMETPKNWTKQELVAYILLYIANADLHETSEEKEFILSKVDRETYAEIHEVFEKDNDYQCIQKIIEGVNTHDYFRDDYAELFADIKLLLYADGEADTMEEATLMFLRKILKEQ